jgi:DNA-binding transcriptional regulator LsrR (DeoR family)
VDGKRLLIDFELAGTTLDDARFVRQAIIRDGLAGVMFWRNYATQGGPCSAPVNQRIAAIALGETAHDGR